MITITITIIIIMIIIIILIYIYIYINVYIIIIIIIIIMIYIYIYCRCLISKAGAQVTHMHRKPLHHLFHLIYSGVVSPRIAFRHKALFRSGTKRPWAHCLLEHLVDIYTIIVYTK